MEKDVKAKSHFKTKLRGDKVIWLDLLFLGLISVVTVYSSSSGLATNNNTSVYTYLFKQLAFVLAGFGALLICYLIPLGWYRKGSVLLLIVSGLLLTYTIFQGTVLNNAVRWINIAGVTFQPSELAKISVVLYLARILENNALSTFKEYCLKVLLPVGAICILCLYGSASVALIVAFISFIILVCSGVNMKYIWRTIGIMVVALSIIVAIHYIFPNTFTRIDTVMARTERFFTNNEQEMSEKERIEFEGKSYQTDQAAEAIQLGKVFGRGPGNSIKRETLPYPYSDFIYATIIEEWGLFGGVMVLALYLWFFFRCIIIAKSCKKMFSTIVVLGLSILIVTQALIHMLVNVGLFPVTGQTLPLISHGGSSYIIISCAFGIILAVNRTIEITIEKEVPLEKALKEYE